MGTRVLRLCQYGLESTHGTAVAADTKLLVTAKVPDEDRQIKIPRVDMGVRTPLLLNSAYAQKLLAEFSIEDANGAYFEMLPLLLSMGIKNISPSGTTPSFVWAAPAVQTAAESVDTATIEIADETMAYEIEYCLCRKIKITGDVTSGEVHVSADLVGRQMKQTTVTAAIAVPTVSLINAKLARVYMDNTWAALGGAELTAALVGFDIEIDTGVHPKFLGAASRLFTSHGIGAILGTMKLTFERTAGVAAEELKYRPASGYVQTPRFVRVGITDGTNILLMDMAGLWTSWDSLSGDVEGNNIDVATLTAGYDVTGTQAISMSVTCDVASV